jgi:hypothetical protein
MAKDKRPLKVFRSVMEDAPPNPILILFTLPVVIFCIIVSRYYEKINNRNI